MQRFLLVMVLSVLAWVLAGCGGDNSPTTPTANPSVSDTNTQTGANRPSEPAGDDYRPDPPSWVASSGFPQLVEVFSYD